MIIYFFAAACYNKPEQGTEDKGMNQANQTVGEAISAYLTTKWAGRTLHYAPEVDSTNRWLKDLAREGAPHGTLCVTDFQSAGRGRMQRRWQARPGEALLMSILVRPERLEPEKAPAIVLIGALAVCRALEEMGVQARIKWPNDIVCGAKKLCGMLLELGLKQTSVDFAILGIGINVKTHPVSAETTHAGSVCEALGREVSREEVASRVLAWFEKYYENWAKNGMDAIMGDYCARCVTLSGRVRAEEQTGVAYEGTGVGLCEDGALVMRLDDGTEKILHAGDVSVRGIMGYV